MQAGLLRELCPQHPVTVTMRSFVRQFDHFDMADVVDFVSIESNVAMQTRAAKAGVRRGHAAVPQEI